MTLKLNKTETAKATQVIDVQIDRANMISLSMDLRRPKNPRIVIGWSLGYLDAGQYVVVDRLERELTPDETRAFLARKVTAGNNYATEFEDGVFGVLQMLGLVAPGVVEVT